MTIDSSTPTPANEGEQSTQTLADDVSNHPADPMEALQADPDALVDKLRSYSRCKYAIHPNEWREDWGGKRGGRVDMVTEPPITISRIMKDLHGSMNILETGYIVIKVQEIKEPHPNTPPEERPDFNELNDVYRISLEPLSKFLVYAQSGYYLNHRDMFIDGAPSIA